MSEVYNMDEIKTLLDNAGIKGHEKGKTKNIIHFGGSGISVSLNYNRIRLGASDTDYNNIVNSKDTLNIEELPAFEISKYENPNRPGTYISYEKMDPVPKEDFEKEMKRLEGIRKFYGPEDRSIIRCVRYGSSELKRTKQTQPHYIGIYSKSTFDQVVKILALNPENVVIHMAF